LILDPEFLALKFVKLQFVGEWAPVFFFYGPFQGGVFGT